MVRGKVKGHAALRDALLSEKSASKFWLSRQVKKKTSQIPMPVKVAQAVVAHENGMPVHRYLSPADLAPVQEMISRLGIGGSRSAPTAPPLNAGARRRAGGQRSVLATRMVNFKGAKLITSVPFLAKNKLKEAQEMADVYGLLYVLENSIREVIRRIMDAKFGPDWWDKEMNAGKVRGVREKVAGRLVNEDNNPWHQRRGADKIDYVDFDDLLTIAESKPNVFFPRLFGQPEWFKQFFKEVVPSRNVVGHMNPLSETNVHDVSVKFQKWQNHLTAREDELNAAMTPAVETASATQEV